MDWNSSNFLVDLLLKLILSFYILQADLKPSGYKSGNPFPQHAIPREPQSVADSLTPAAMSALVSSVSGNPNAGAAIMGQNQHVDYGQQAQYWQQQQAAAAAGGQQDYAQQQYWYKWITLTVTIHPIRKLELFMFVGRNTRRGTSIRITTTMAAAITSNNNSRLKATVLHLQLLHHLVHLLAASELPLQLPPDSAVKMAVQDDSAVRLNNTQSDQIFEERSYNLVTLFLKVTDYEPSIFEGDDFELVEHTPYVDVDALNEKTLARSAELWEARITQL